MGASQSRANEKNAFVITDLQKQLRDQNGEILQLRSSKGDLQTQLEHQRMISIGAAAVAGVGCAVALYTIKSSASMKTLCRSQSTKIDNFAQANRRLEIDLDKAKKFAVQGFAKDMLEVMDNLKRCNESIASTLMKGNELPTVGATSSSSSSDVSSFDLEGAKIIHEGVELTKRSLEKILGKHGVVRIDDKEGETAFDPNVHEAMFQVPTVDDNVIAVVERDGYLLNERVIRPTRVGVGCKKEEVRSEFVETKELDREKNYDRSREGETTTVVEKVDATPETNGNTEKKMQSS